jgi:hypothetical protein
VDENRKESKDNIANRARKTPGINPALSSLRGIGVSGDQRLIRGLCNMQELARTQEIWQQPAVYEVNLRQEAMSGEPGHLILAYLTVRDYSNTSKSTVVLQNVGVWTGMLLFSASFYYGLARLVIWAASL